ncbi:hypothetical protein ACIGBJ_21965 [Stutzerimonas stutzeri]|uniref:hypothetical protein n=1 Tax=Stutzerimonas stutzeri TaxID=316 RepID=UPI003595F07E
MKSFSQLLITTALSAFIVSAASLFPVGLTVAENGAERTPGFRIAEDGSDRTPGFRVAENGSDRTAIGRLG